MKPELRFEIKTIPSAALGEESPQPDLLGELILQNNLVFDLDEDDELYEGYGRRANAYPYRQYSMYTRNLEKKDYKIAVLENDFVKAVFLPELGGRLWELWDKKEDRNLLYTNDVIYYGNLAVRNAWFSGGVEWNVGVIGHTPLTVEQLYTAETTTEEGAPVLRMYEYERARKITYQMDFWLEESERFLNCRMRIVNESAQVLPMYWWSNMAVPEYEDGRIIVPAEQAYTCEDGSVFKVDIPLVKGIDITDYKKIPKSVDYFFDIPKNAPKYIANVDKDGYGMLQMSTDRLRSRKLFSWGNSDASDRWQEFLTDKAGRYIEVQAGLAKTQYGCIPMAPHTAWEWLEQYGPIRVSEKELQLPHDQRSRKITEKILKENLPVQLEERLLKTRKMAKNPAKVLLNGSGYGALAVHGKWTEHLQFSEEKESIRNWKKFFETGILHRPDPMDSPDEFLIEENNLNFIEESIKTTNGDNWYAYYQAGIGAYISGQYKKAQKFLERSLLVAENPWSLHALSCLYLLRGEKKLAARYICRGMHLFQKMPDNGSKSAYLKEGFKILFISGAYQEIIESYEQSGPLIQKTGKIKFYYSFALHKLSRDQEAFAVLEEDGGLLIEDIREGEDLVAQLWSDLYEALFQEKAKVPHRYNFKAF